MINGDSDLGLQGISVPRDLCVMVRLTPTMPRLALLLTLLVVVGYVGAQEERPKPEAPLVARVTGIAGCKAVIEINNRSASDIYWLNRFISERGELLAEIFDVRGEQGALPYLGVLAEMLPPTAEDFELLKAGESYRFEVPLATYYPIEPEERYELRLTTFVAWFPAPLQLNSLEAVLIAELKGGLVSFTCAKRGVPRWWIASAAGVVVILVGLLAFRRVRSGEIGDT